MMETILLPLDRSTLAECTVDHALRVAKAFGARVILLSVIETDQRQNEVDSAEWRMARAEVQGYLNRIARAFQEAAVSVETRVLEGRAAERILDLAREADVDLILLSSHGRGGVTDFPLSGTAAKILACATVSLMIVRPGQLAAEPERPQPAGKGLYGTILVPFDCTKRSEWSARLAASLARSEGGELLLVTVVAAPEVLGDPPEGSEAARLAQRLASLNRECAEAQLSALQKNLAGEGLSIRWRVVQDTDVTRALAAVAVEERVSLVVLSAHGSCGDPGRPHGIIAACLLEHLTRPVIVFQDAPAHAPTDPRPSRKGARVTTAGA